MNPSQIARIAAVAAVGAAVVAILIAKQNEIDSPAEAQTASTGDLAAVPLPVAADPVAGVGDGSGPSAGAAPVPAANPPAPTAGLPRLVDLGADKCIPCKKMAPILEALREEFATRFEVVFIDVWKNKQAAVPYRIRIIPTQIFFDGEGNELFRHEGFFSRQDILGTWAKFGYAFTAEQPDQVIAYYLHRTIRCQSCLEIEQYSREAIHETFADDLEAGRLQWHAYDMELPEHEHFQKQFDLSTPSLVLVHMDDDQVAGWEVLEEVWALVYTPDELEEYVRARTGAFIETALGTE